MRAILATPALVDTELPLPVPGPHDLLVRIEAVAVNPIDTKLRAAVGAGAAPKQLGWDAAGVVAATGERVSRFRVGDPVMFAGDAGRAGCNAEAVLVDERLVGRKPARLSWAEAAAVPLTGLTAWEALFERLGLDPSDEGGRGRSLLILGGAGGVGSIAIQLACRAGAVVIASASRPESAPWARSWRSWATAAPSTSTCSRPRACASPGSSCSAAPSSRPPTWGGRGRSSTDSPSCSRPAPCAPPWAARCPHQRRQPENRPRPAGLR